ncbi:MAG: polymer-forming cytoskeletal protein [Lachnospiraceae bacterium]|nr:polymer-forming cytoskeletal protein [Lachnospiraceae bacterium]
MGFFSDLKEDLSQAVSDFKEPETVKEEVVEEELKAEDFADIDAELDDADLDLESDIDDDLADILEGLDEKYESAKLAEQAAASPVVEETIPVVEEPEQYTMPAPTPVVSQPIPTIQRTVASDEVSTIMESMIINGNMATEGSLEIRGSIVGNVEALGKLDITGSIQGNSSASEIFADGAKITGEVKSMGPIKIGQSTTIIGNVYATSAVIAGAIKGDIDVKGPVILDSTAIVLGNIKSKSVQINNGAVIEGMCSQCYAEVNPISFFEELKKMK